MMPAIQTASPAITNVRGVTLVIKKPNERAYKVVLRDPQQIPENAPIIKLASPIDPMTPETPAHAALTSKLKPFLQVK